MANISLTDLMGALQRSGYNPSSSSYDMGQQEPQILDNASANVQTSDPMIPYLKQKYGDQVAQIAQIDQKLSGVYSDPKSPYFIKNPTKAYGFKAKAQNLGYTAAKGIASDVKTRQTALNTENNQRTSAVKSLFTQLKSNKVAEETNQTRADKIAKTPTQLVFGQRVSTPTKGKAGTSTAENKRLDASTLSDMKAQNIFAAAPTKFQEQWIRDLNEHSIPPAKYTAQNMQKDVNNWQIQQKTNARKQSQQAAKNAPTTKKASGSSARQW